MTSSTNVRQRERLGEGSAVCSLFGAIRCMTWGSMCHTYYTSPAEDPDGEHAQRSKSSGKVTGAHCFANIFRIFAMRLASRDAFFAPREGAAPWPQIVNRYLRERENACARTRNVSVRSESCAQCASRSWGGEGSEGDRAPVCREPPAVTAWCPWARASSGFGSGAGCGTVSLALRRLQARGGEAQRTHMARDCAQLPPRPLS